MKWMLAWEMKTEWRAKKSLVVSKEKTLEVGSQQRKDPRGVPCGSRVCPELKHKGWGV